MVPATLVLPAASVTRTVPLRAVCTTDRFGSTVSDIASPISAPPVARVTCWESAARGAAAGVRPGRVRQRRRRHRLTDLGAAGGQGDLLVVGGRDRCGGGGGWGGHD